MDILLWPWFHQHFPIENLFDLFIKLSEISGIHMSPPFFGDQRRRSFWESHIFRTRISKLGQVVLVLLNGILLPSPLQLDQTCLPDENMEQHCHILSQRKQGSLQSKCGWKIPSVHSKAASTWVVTASSSPTSLSTCSQRDEGSNFMDLSICHLEMAHDGHKPKDNLKALKTSAPKKEFWLVVSTPLKNI